MLGQGYTAGVGMTIGTVFGRIAGTNTGRAAAKTPAAIIHAQPRIGQTSKIA